MKTNNAAEPKIKFSKPAPRGDYTSLKAAMIDNYDSFTFNLVRYLKELGLINLEVVRNDAASAKEILGSGYDYVFISPGPSDPDHAGVCLDLVKEAAYSKTPVFGVCLGLQCIAQAFGASIIKQMPPVHGKTSEIIHNGSDLFEQIPEVFTATRYHSLIIDEKTLPAEITVTARTRQGTIMAISHDTLPIEAVQFHPESVLTSEGHLLIENFVRKNRPH